MLTYLEVALSEKEVPNEHSICIYIDGCVNHCPNCHYALLQEDSGDPLIDNIEKIIKIYLNSATCVCFLGEGKGTNEERDEFNKLVSIVHSYGLKACLYCGRDVEVEKWMNIFDYVKVGSYQEKYGPLTSSTTNQRMYKINNNELVDITWLFFDD